MFFESQSDLFGVSPRLADAFEAYEYGHSRQARELIEGLDDGGNPTVSDLLFYADVVRACGDESRFRAVAKYAYMHYPKNLWANIQWARVTAMRGYPLKAYELLAKIQVGGAGKRLVDSLLASNLSQMGCRDRYQKYARQAEAGDDGSVMDGLVAYELCYAGICAKHWKRAVAWGEKALKYLPAWPRLRVMLSRCYLSVGEYEKAVKVLGAVIDAGVEDATAEMSYLFLQYAGCEWQSLKPQVDRFNERWQGEDFKGSLALIILAYVFMGELEKAREAAKGDEHWSEILEANALTEKNVILPLPAIVQEHDLCVPTSVSLVCGYHKENFSPQKLYQQMDGHEGTALWKMIDVMSSKGFDVYIINLKEQTLIDLIDQGYPIVVPISGLFMEHVQVICGYSGALSSIVVRDPANPALSITQFKDIEKVYGPAGGYGMLLIPPANKWTFKFDDDWANPTGEALVQLTHATFYGDVEDSREAYEAVPEEDLSALKRAQYGYGVAITEREYYEELERIAQNRKFDPETRLQCLLQAFNPELTKRIQDEESELKPEERIHFSGTTGRLLNFRALIADGKWEEAKRVGEFLIQEISGQSELWLDLGRVSIELGDFERGEECLRWAEDVSPVSLWVKNSLHAYFPSNLTYAERMAAYRKFVEEYPNANSMAESELPLIEEGDDGLLLEKRYKELIRKKPLSSRYYISLANWYLRQNREDLAKRLIQKSRAYLSEEDMAPFYFEASEEEPSGEQEDTQAQDDLKISSKTEDGELLRVAHDYRRENPDVSAKAMRFLSERVTARSLLWQNEVDYYFIKYLIHAEACVKANKMLVAEGILPKQLPGVLPFNMNRFLNRCEVGSMNETVALSLNLWVESHRTRSQWNEDLEFNCALLLEDAGLLNQAEERHRSLLKKRPGYFGSAYRLACICDARSDVVGAVDGYQKTLAGSPSNTGSLVRLAELAQSGFAKVDEVEIRKTLCNIDPYDFSKFEAYLLSLIESSQVDKAELRLRETESRWSALQFSALSARIALENKNAALAFKQLASVDADEIEDVGLKRHIFVTQLDSALAIGRRDDAQNILSRASSAFPDDLFFLKTKGDLLLHSDSRGAAEFYKSVLIEKGIHNIFVQGYLSAKGLKSIKPIKELIKGVPREIAEEVGVCVMQILNYHNELKLEIKFHEYIDFHYKDFYSIRERFARNLLMMGENKRAVKIAKDLAKRDPAGNWDYLLGCCIQEVDPRDSLKYFRKHYELTGSIDALQRLARGQQLCGERDEAKEAYLKCYEMNPLDDLVITNLVVLGESPSRFYDSFCEAIVHKTFGDQSEYFLVDAVKSAAELSRPLPHRWIECAEARFVRFTHEKPFLDEKNVWGQLCSTGILRMVRQTELNRSGSTRGDSIMVPGRGIAGYLRRG
ncbi:MAG: C39 family peptidase [Opitutales bacterium]